MIAFCKDKCPDVRSTNNIKGESSRDAHEHLHSTESSDIRYIDTCHRNMTTITNLTQRSHCHSVWAIFFNLFILKHSLNTQFDENRILIIIIFKKASQLSLPMSIKLSSVSHFPSYF